MVSKIKVLDKIVGSEGIVGFVVKYDSVDELNRLLKIVPLDFIYQITSYARSSSSGYYCFVRGSYYRFTPYKRYRRKYRRHLLVSIDTLEELVKEAQKQGLDFWTGSRLPGSYSISFEPPILSEAIISSESCPPF